VSFVDVLVAGGGPAGLAAARAAALAGRSVLVLDDEDGPSGSGLTLWPNALVALRTLGLAEAVMAAGQVADGMLMSRPDGRSLQQVSAERMAEACHGNGIGLTREALLRELVAGLPAGVERRRERLLDLTQDEAGVQVRTTGGEYRAAVVVGADGARSRVRELLLPQDGLRRLGMRVVRGTSRLRLGTPAAEVSMGRGLQFGIFGLPDGVYWFAAYPARRTPAGTARVSGADALRTAGELFGGWHEPIPQLMASTADSHVLVHDVVDRRPPAAVWGRGRVTLAGDAAHLAAPTMGQGTCHALEDAVALGNALARGLEPRYLRAYEAARTPRSAAMVRRSHLAAVSGQWANPLVCGLRDLAMRSTPAGAQTRQLRAMFEVGAADLLLA
jgi:2-polyprenyl-6-methoxyphenol hydroxylase-like FAD-dependent oxidoreductase